MIKRFGQLGNRLFLFSHFVANAVEHGYALANPSFNGYARYFEATSTGDFDGLPIRLNGFRRPFFDSVFELVQRPPVFDYVQRCYRRLPLPANHPKLLYLHDDDSFDLNNPEYLAAAQQRTVLVHGWQFRDKSHFAKHAPLLRHLFRPIAEHRTAVAALINRLRQTTDILVGVHIRRGDYAVFNNGGYYYDDATYARTLHELLAQLPAHKRVAFLLCSNEPVDLTAYAGLTVHQPTGHFIEDLYALAACDYVLGPPSSYSMWASFYGEVPLLHLHHAQQAVELSQFEVYTD
ncbi:hypothetical protein [Hymenobacter sediminis]|uniref:hypothetical protein n=1 Tax=Hymenobacter sediminis TaxID=2218621 RepID=UPI0013902029|nr:hypothetical protein [Hymenobacter sediminis]